MTMLPAADDAGSNEVRLPSGGGTINHVTEDRIKLLDSIGIPILVLRRNFIVACFNRAAADALSLTPSDIGHSPRVISFLSGLQKLDRWCEEVVSTNVPTQHDVRVADKSFIVRIAPYADGQVGWTVLTFTNVTAFRASIDQAIYEREYAKCILNSVADPLVVLSRDLHILTGNRAFYSLFQISREAIQGLPLNRLGNGALDLPRLGTQLKEMLASGLPFQALEIDCEWPDGRRRTMSLHACTCALPGHSSGMALLSLHDITAQKRAAAHISVLAHEAEHRTRNILTTVQAAVSLTKADTVADLKTAIEGRIKALANVNQLFVDSRWAGAELSDLVSQELAPYRRNEGGRRVRIEGANHLLEPGVAQALAVTVHELATNAAKYGALSTSDGKVEIAWELKTGGVLLFRWLESGGPPVRPPERQGFGTRVVATMIAQLLGHVEYDWQSSGLVCQITLPIAP